MKKLLLTIGILSCAIFSSNAQEISKNAIGVRIGNNNGFGSEASYQRKLSQNNRLEFNLGFRDRFDSAKITALYEFVWELEDNLNWYAGFGGGVVTSNSATIFASGVIGLEYNFKSPILISLDYKPEFGITGHAYDGFNSDFGLAVRYQF